MAIFFNVKKSAGLFSFIDLLLYRLKYKGVIISMNNKTKNYFTILLLSVIVFSIAKYITNKLNNKQSIVSPIENKPIIVIKQQSLSPIVEKTNNIIKNRLLVGGSWKSR